jgi:hypothetical protein
LTKFDYVVSSLTKEPVKMVSLKDRLLASHTLTNFQKIEKKVHEMDSLGARKPSKLMAQMLGLCPRGHEANEFFLFLFLQRLRREQQDVGRRSGP